MYAPTKAIVLRSIRYSEADLIATCYTASDGLKSYILKGILKTKKGKLKAPMFQPFSQLEIMARHRNKGTLDYIKEASITSVNPEIRTDVYKSSMAIFLAEVIQHSIKEEEQNIQLFNFLEEAINKLETEEDTADFHLFFLVDFTKYLGFYPHQPDDDYPYFNLQQGCFEERETDNYSISGNNCTLLKKLLISTDFSSLGINRERRQSFLNFLLAYYQIQLPGFRTPKSLDVFSQLFS